MNPHQFTDYVQNNPLMYPPMIEGYYPGDPPMMEGYYPGAPTMMEGYYPGAPQPVPTLPDIPRVEFPTRKVYEDTHSAILKTPDPSTLVPPERVSERVQKRKNGGASSQEVSQENCDILQKLDLFEVQIESTQRVAETLWKRLSSEEEERKKEGHVQNQAIIKLRDVIVNDHAEFRKGVEILAKNAMYIRKKLKTHNQIINDFQGLVESYTNDKMEHYLNERCLAKFNAMADKILTETEMTPEEIGDIAKSIGLDTEEDKGPPPSSSDEGYLAWNLDDVMVLFEGEDRDVQPISG